MMGDAFSDKRETVKIVKNVDYQGFRPVHKPVQTVYNLCKLWKRLWLRSTIQCNPLIDFWKKRKIDFLQKGYRRITERHNAQTVKKAHNRQNQNDKRGYPMPNQGFFLCHPERKRRIFAASIEKGSFVTSFLRMTYTGGAPEKIQDFYQVLV